MVAGSGSTRAREGAQTRAGVAPIDAGAEANSSVSAVDRAGRLWCGANAGRQSSTGAERGRGAGDRDLAQHVVLTNNTSEQIIEIYVSDDRTDNWQEDYLGLEFLPSGSSVSVDVDDRNGNCRVDVKTVLPRRHLRGSR